MTTKTTTHNDTEYTISLEDNDFAVNKHHNGITEEVASGTWDGAFGGDCSADLGDDLWHEIEMALIDMESATYTGPEIATDYAMAELCGAPTCRLELCIDWENRTIGLSSVHESNNSWTAREHHGHETTYRIDIMSASDFAGLIKTLIPMVDKMADAYDSEWDGSNHVATFDLDYDSKVELEHEIQGEIEGARFDSVGGLWDAADYLDADPPEVAADATDEWIAARATEIQSDAHDNGIHIHDADEYLTELRTDADDLCDAWDRAVAAGAKVYRVMECDGTEHTEGEPENRGGAQVLKDGQRWLYVDDMDGYSVIDGSDIKDWQSGKLTTTLELVE